jgi:Zn-dependent protease with chaperone function
VDFFGAQQQAKRNTALLVFLFVLAVLGIIGAVYFALAFGLSVAGARGIWHQDAFLVIAGLTLLVVGLGALFRTVQLRGGGPAVAEMLGGTRVRAATTDLQEKTLYNVVEEMSIAAGVPMPSVYVLASESSINAFAAGRTQSDAAIAVTRGTLDNLSRDELQGVIAHEFSHVLNADMRLNLRLMSVLFGITCIATGGYILMRVAGRSSGSSKKGGAAQVFVAGLTLYVVGSLGKVFATLIQAAVSRQREFLADAAAVQFTRNPKGIAGALRKIKNLTSGSRVQHAQAAEASHLFFADALVHKFTSWFASHPPLERRILAIQPMFARYQPELDAVREKVRAATPARAGAAHATAGSPLPSIPGMPSLPGGVDVLGGVIALSPEQIVGAIGTLDSERLAASHDWLAQLPPEVRGATNDAFAASALVFALLLDTDDAVRAKQLVALAAGSDASTYAEALSLRRHTQSLPVQARLPLVDLALPALRTMSKAQYTRFKTCVGALIGGDDKVSLFEFALGRVLKRHLARVYEHVPVPRAEFQTLLPVAAECALVLSALAHSAQDAEQAPRAFHAGAEQLPQGPGVTAPLLHPASACTPDALVLALDRLARLAPRAKHQLLRCAARVIAHDGRAHVAELELLRAIADGLDVPVPPLVLTG